MQKVSQYEFFTSDDVSECNAWSVYFIVPTLECSVACVHCTVRAAGGQRSTHTCLQFVVVDVFIFFLDRRVRCVPVVGDVGRKKNNHLSSSSFALTRTRIQ